MKLAKFSEKEACGNFKLEMEPRLWHTFALEVLSQSDLKGKSVLDVGAGSGYILGKLKGKGVTPYAIEISDHFIASLGRQGIRAEKTNISVESFSYADNSFDYVIFTEVLEHLAFPDHALREIYRVLKPEGKLFVSTHNCFNLYMRLKYLTGTIPNQDLDVTEHGQHLRLYNYVILLRLLHNFGFKRILNRSWFKLGKLSFYVPTLLTPAMSRYFLLICMK